MHLLPFSSHQSPVEYLEPDPVRFAFLFVLTLSPWTFCLRSLPELFSTFFALSSFDTPGAHQYLSHSFLLAEQLSLSVHDQK